MSSGDATGHILSVCIVNWNTRELLRACLESLRRNPSARAQLEIIVVDNASSDSSAELVARDFPEVRLLANAENRGYAAGNNQAIAASGGEYVLLLNPDTEVAPGALDKLLEFLRDHPEAAGVAPRLVGPDGATQRSCRGFPDPWAVFADALGLARLFPRSRRLGRYRLTWWNHDDLREVDQPMASALLLRRSALKRVGAFDEDFPIFFNDVDLCYRLKQAGWRLYFDPEATVLHHHGASTAQVRRRMIIESHRSLARFYRKHYRGRRGCWPVLALNRLGLWLRLAALALRGGGRQEDSPAPGREIGA